MSASHDAPPLPDDEAGEDRAGYPERLRRLATELILSEERQRREIAEDLHDHLGQGLAMLRLQLQRLKGDAVFCGLDHPIGEMERLLDQAIRYTRSLTFEISPPLLYELGLGPALDRLAKVYAKRHQLEITVELEDLPTGLDQPLRVMLFKSVRELLVNVVKHAQAQHVIITARGTADSIELTVQDDGVGFGDHQQLWQTSAMPGHGFGLFSIQERLALLGGRLVLEKPAMGSGAVARMIAPCATFAEDAR